MRIVLVVQYLRARRLLEARTLATRHALGFGVAVIVWILSALTPAPERYWLWAAALAIDFATPWLAANRMLDMPPDPTHFPERFGLFTIILIGEFVAAVMRGIESQEDWTFSAAATAFTSMAFAFVLRWSYFDVARSANERRVRTRRDAIRFHLWHYCHLPMFLGIAIAGVGFQRAITVASEGHLNRSEVWILCIAVISVMIALSTLGATSDAAQMRRSLPAYLWPQYAIALATIILGICADRMHTLVVVLTLLTGCVLQTLLAQRETVVEDPQVAA
jgi:low temperature requirement protein LtrA